MLRLANFGYAVSAEKVLHSHDYRYAEPFSGLSVVVLGAKASGLDISTELANVGAQVTDGRRTAAVPTLTPVQLWLMLCKKSVLTLLHI